jgi:NADH dehydrogenase (ubiquinone) flavoprotein 2
MSETTFPHEHEQPASFAFSPENQERAKAVIAKYPAGCQASAVMPLLDLAQRQHGGWLPRAAMDQVAAMLGMPPVRVYEVASFYTMFNLKPVGRHHVQVCTNISCWLRGSDEVMHACRKTLGVEVDGTTPDQLFTLSEVECQGACVNGPMMKINDDFYEDLTAASAETVLSTLREGGAPKPGPQNGRQGCAPLGATANLGSKREEGAS